MDLRTEHYSGVGSALSITALIRAVKQHLRQRRVYRSTLRQLRALSQRDLDDLGIARSMITRLAAEAARDNKN